MKWWDGTRWSEFASLGWPEVPDEIYPTVTVAAPLTGPLAACSWGPNRMDVFARGSSGEVIHKWWGGRDWSAFVSLGMPVTADAEPTPLSSTGAIASCTWRVNRLDVFTRAVDGNLYHAWWDGSWSAAPQSPHHRVRRCSAFVPAQLSERTNLQLPTENQKNVLDLTAVDAR